MLYSPWRCCWYGVRRRVPLIESTIAFVVVAVVAVLVVVSYHDVPLPKLIVF